MPLDLATLRAWIDADPALSSLPISTASAMQIADVFNAKNIDASRDVPAYEARQIVLLSGEWAKIKLLAEERPATTAISVAMTFVDALSDRETVLPAGNRAHIAGLLDVLVAASVLSGASKAALMLLFATKISRAEELFGEPVQVGHVARAIAM